MTQPPMTPNYQSQSFPPQGSGGLATAAMVVGIIAVCLSLVLGCIPFFGPGLGSLLGIVAILLGVVAMSQGGPASAGRARVGLILGIVALVIAIGWHVAMRAGISFLQKKGGQFNQQIQDNLKKAEEEQQKAAEQMRQQQQNRTTEPSTQPSSTAPNLLPWRVASASGTLPERTVYFAMSCRT